MIFYTLKRLKQAPLPALAVLLFSAVLAAVLCFLQAANEAEQRSYEETYPIIPVTMTVCSLSGTQVSDLEAPGWVADLFTGNGKMGRGLTEYGKDLRIKSTRRIDNDKEVKADFLVGVTSLRAEKKLLPENGGSVTWYEGYDENTLLGGELVCLAPEGLTDDWDEETPGQQLKLWFYHKGRDEYGLEKEWEYECFLTVAGTYRSGSGSDLYCPYAVVELVYQKVAQDRVIDCVSVTLTDNLRLAELEKEAGYWFARPNATGTKTKWSFAGYEYYPYAFDIDDSLLRSAAATLENSILINKVCTLLAFALSAGAGFFVGFLMIRQRKREIALMRTLGTRNGAVYLGFALEQILCVVVGAALGGAPFGWHPVERLLIFIGIYFIGLTAALLVFLHQNLLSTLKEGE